jgi:hypothetical protein
MIEYIFLAALVILIGTSIYIIYSLKNITTTASATASATASPSVKDAKPNEDASGSLMSREFIPPYATDYIDSVDDYEYNMVFQNEGDRGMTRATRDLLMSQYPMDWTVQPPSSDIFQQGLASYKESFTGQGQALPEKNPYNAIDGSRMTPPVYKDEKDILATYTPKKPNELTTYDAADAKELIDKIYSGKGLIANYKQTGDNTFTIMSTRPKDEKNVYEDEDPSTQKEEEQSTQAPASSEAVASMGEGTFEVPANVQNYKTPDPFFTVNPNNRTRDGKWDYSSWTPGLERMFAPTEPQPNWY